MSDIKYVILWQLSSELKEMIEEKGQKIDESTAVRRLNKKVRNHHLSSAFFNDLRMLDTTTHSTISLFLFTLVEVNFLPISSGVGK